LAVVSFKLELLLIVGGVSYRTGWLNGYQHFLEEVMMCWLSHSSWNACSFL